MRNESDVEPLIAEEESANGTNGLNILRSSTSLSNLGGSQRAIVVIEGESSWSRRREINSRIRRQAEQHGIPAEDVIVTTSPAPFSLPRNMSTNNLGFVEENNGSNEEDPLSGVRVPVPYGDLISEAARTEGAEIIRYYDRPFHDRRRRSDAVEESNRHRNNLISRLAGPPSPLPEESSQVDVPHPSTRRRFLAYPDHLVPPQYFLLNVPVVSSQVEADGKQSSLVTILAIWNTMMGTSLLATPWAISQSGLIMGPLIALFTAGLAGYTAITIVRDRKEVEKFETVPEFAPMVGCVLGRKAEITATIFSLLAVAGAGVVYWVLMSNFAYNGVAYIYNYASGSHDYIPVNSSIYSSHDDVICPSHDPHLQSSESPSTFEQIWNPTTAPIFLLLLIFPLISVKSVGFFTKLNSIGTLSVFFMMGLVSYYAASWGVNVDLSDPASALYVPLFKWTFPCLTGTLSLGFFIHNCVITITNNNKNQENNTRDVGIAFSLVTLTYLAIGTLFYISFPIEKSCLEDNFLNNFHSNDGLAVFTRWLLLFQLMTVFPLIMYIMRSQVYLAMFNIQEPSYMQNFICNSVAVTICVLVAIFYPKIGTIIRFSGSLCGFFLIFFLPPWVHVVISRERMDHDERGTLFVILHGIIVLLGLANFIAQFFI